VIEITKLYSSLTRQDSNKKASKAHSDSDSSVENSDLFEGSSTSSRRSSFKFKKQPTLKKKSTFHKEVSPSNYSSLMFVGNSAHMDRQRSIIVEEDEDGI
jgi:hypothetical protein